MLEISKELDKTINNWINHHAPNLEKIESGIYISEFDDSNSERVLRQCARSFELFDSQSRNVHRFHAARLERQSSPLSSPHGASGDYTRDHPSPPCLRIWWFRCRRNPALDRQAHEKSGHRARGAATIASRETGQLDQRTNQK